VVFMEWSEEAIQAAYERLIRHAEDGTPGEAIKVHAQVCGLLAYALNVHPDEVAWAVGKYLPHTVETYERER
jgi:hypothetical protein